MGGGSNSPSAHPLPSPHLFTHLISSSCAEWRLDRPFTAPLRHSNSTLPPQCPSHIVNQYRPIICGGSTAIDVMAQPSMSQVDDGSFCKTTESIPDKFNDTAVPRDPAFTRRNNDNARVRSRCGLVNSTEDQRNSLQQEQDSVAPRGTNTPTMCTWVTKSHPSSKELTNTRTA